MKTRGSALRITAAALVVVALLTLYLNFFTLAPVLRNELRSQLSDMQSDMLEDMQDELEDVMGMAFASSKEYKMASRFVNKLMKICSGSGLSVMDARGLLASATRLINRFAKSPLLAMSMMDGMDATALSAIRGVNIGFTLFVLLYFVSGGFALYGIYRRRRARGYWFAAMMLVLLILEGLIVMGVNISAEDSMRYLFRNAGMGVGSALFMTAWPFIGLICAIASIVLCYMTAAPRQAGPQGFQSAPNPPQGSAGAAFASAMQMGKAVGRQVGRKVSRAAATAAVAASAAAASARAANSWTCPRCGKQMDAGGRFCTGCGTPRPERKACPQCGAEVKDGMAFCTRCGCRLNGAPAGFGQNPQAPYNPPRQGPSNQSPQAAVNQIPQTAYNQNPQAFGGPSQQAAASRNPQARPAAATPNAFAGLNLDATVKEDGSAPGAQPLPVTFIVDQGSDGAHRELTLPLKDALIIGRGPACALRIDDGRVSGQHLRVERSGSELFVTDLNSSNGTRLNDAPLTDRTALTSGDRLALGGATVVVRW